MDPVRAVGVVAENSPEFIRKIFTLWDEGALVVPLRKADDTARLQAAKVTEVQLVGAGSGWLKESHQPRQDDSPALMQFTSGTEGEPKGVLLTHRNLADAVSRLNDVMRINADIREYVGVPVYHSFGFGRCRAVLAAGGQAFIPARGFNPVEINAMLERGEINAISAVPSLWRILLQSEAVSRQAAQQVRWIEIGSQFMSAEEKIALRTLFSNATIVQHYGLTEASRSTFLEVHSASTAHLESVGKAWGDVAVAISDSGRIMIRGPHVATKVFSKGTATDPRDDQGWLITNDLGHLQDGYLFYKGRADDVINCGGLKLPPDELERSICALLDISADLAVCRVPDPVRGDGILVVASKEVQASDEQILQAAMEATARYGVSARDATHVMRVDQLARTENGKIKRQQLAKAFTDLQPAPTAASGTQQNAGSLQARLCTILGVSDVTAQDTFISLGGDSLRYIQASIALEKVLGYLPQEWEKTPIVQLAALQPQRSSLSQIEPSVILRALAIVSVVMNHAGVFAPYFAIDGAAMMLLLPSGYNFARFQLQRVIDTGLARMALVALPRVIVPTVLLLALQQVRHKEFVPSALFLFHNFLGTPPTFSLWFIEVFVQMHLILALLLCIAPIRAVLQRSPWESSMAALAISTLINLLSPFVWDTDYLYNLLPHRLIWYFFLGWCLLFAKQGWQRWVNTACVVTAFFGLAVSGGPSYSSALWILFGGLFLNWAPALRLPTAMVRGLSAVASASLYIYVSHFLVQEPAARLFPRGGALGAAFAGIVVGLLYWLFFERVWQLGARLVKRR